MAFTNTRCKETGVWAGRCGHGEIALHRGERFPQCPECRRGIDWHRVSRTDRDQRTGRDDSDWADEGWWPGKAADTGWGR
ncbi:MAG TPA: hypothetical protein VMB72_04200 [Acidimicrobiales bacterium]|nr:hypothetical protein [Acidimicrobiales bacterium]